MVYIAVDYNITYYFNFWFRNTEVLNKINKRKAGNLRKTIQYPHVSHVTHIYMFSVYSHVS
jgi:hypothetical protein